LAPPEIRYHARTDSAEGTVHPRYTDVNYTLKFGRQKVLRSFLIVGILAIAVGILGTSSDFFRGKDQYIAYLAFALGVLLAGYTMHGTFNKTSPIAVLSPAGIALDIEWVKNFLIPWHEIKAVEKIDITVPTRGWHKTIRGVTAVSVTRNFYERIIHVDNPILRGPGWDNAFIDNGKTVQVTLNPAVLPASAEEIFVAVDTRWKAFRGKTRPTKTEPS
jgi:hypothetical protein